MPTSPRLDNVNLYNSDLFQSREVEDTFALLRREAPVFWHEQGEQPFWCITKFDDIRLISQDPQRFTSTKALQLGDTLGQQLPRNLLTTDPPEHTDLRRMTASLFRASVVKNLSPIIDSVVDSQLESAIAKGECDFLEEVAAPLPIAVICALLGVPQSDWKMVFDLGNRIVASTDPEFTPDLVDGSEDALTVARRNSEQARLELAQYLASLGEEKKRGGLVGDDVMTALLQEKLELEDFLIYCLLLVVAGNETTRQGIAGGVAALLEFPDQWGRLSRDRSLLDSAIEEMLRWTTPVAHFLRVATTDVEMRGKQIRDGDRVALWYMSGNRDEEVYQDPFKFDVGRGRIAHLSFGFGEHFCLGGPLARLEMKLFFKRFLDRVSKLSFVGEPQYIRSNFLNGIKHMHVKF